MFGIDDAIMGAIIGGGLSFLGTESTNSANAAQASLNRDFQATQSGTSYQRAVKDMEAAGLNPMLAYSQGGATTPGGAQAVMQNSLSNAVGSGGSALSQLRASDLVKEQTNKTVAETDASKADAKLKLSQAAVNAASVPRIIQDTKTGFASAAQLEAVTERLRKLLDLGMPGVEWSKAHADSTKAGWEAEMAGQQYKGGKVGADIGFTRANTRVANSSVPVNMARSRALAASALLDELGSSKGHTFSKAYDSGWLDFQPYLDAYGNSAATGVAKQVLRRMPIQSH